MLAYLDTGVLIKLYTRETNSERVIAFVRNQRLPIVFSSFQRAEFITALHSIEGRGNLMPDDTIKAVDDVANATTTGVLRWHEPDWTRIFDLTANLATIHGAATLCRTLDAIHVSLALTLQVSEFATLDKRQALLADAAGLNVVAP